MPQSAQKSRVAVALLNASGYARGFDLQWTTDGLDVSVLTSTAREYIPGQDASTANVNMLLDTSGAAGGQFAALHNTKAATAAPFTMAPDGFTTGSLAVMPSLLTTNLTIGSVLTDAVTVSMAAASTGNFDVGTILEDFTAITATGNGTARDGGAASANGGVAHLHVSAFSGLTSNTVTIEHSVDGSTSWATLVTFSAATAATSQRVEVAAGTTVRRYLRVVDTVVGTGTNTRLVAFARR